jgi:hypothetical protein
MKSLVRNTKIAPTTCREVKKRITQNEDERASSLKQEWVKTEKLAP